MERDGPHWNDRRRQAAAQRLAASFSLSSTPAAASSNTTTAPITLTAVWLQQHCGCASASPLISTPEDTKDDDHEGDEAAALAQVTHLSLTKIKDASAMVDLDLLGDLLPSLGQSAFCLFLLHFCTKKRVSILLFTIPPFLPLLESLSFTHSCLPSLRDLGTRLTHLLILDLTSCSLTALDGLAAFPLLLELYLSHNLLRDLTPLFLHDRLSVLDLAQNPHLVLPPSLAPLHILASCSRLHTLTLKGTPVEVALEGEREGGREGCYRRVVGSLVPQLKVLDGRKMGGGREGGREEREDEEGMDEEAWRSMMARLQALAVKEEEEEKEERGRRNDRRRRQEQGIS